MVSAFNPYNTLPVADEALDKGGAELLRAGLADGELFVSLRSPFPKPDQWGEVLAEITLNLASLYSANGDYSENDVIAAVAAGYRDSLRKYLEKGTARRKLPAKGKAKPLAKSKAKVKTPLKAKAKPLTSKSLAKTPAKSKSASKAVAGRKGARGQL